MTAIFIMEAVAVQFEMSCAHLLNSSLIGIMCNNMNTANDSAHCIYRTNGSNSNHSLKNATNCMSFDDN